MRRNERERRETMKNNGKHRPLFERVKSGLEDGIKFAREQLTLRKIEHPQPPPVCTAAVILKLRQSLHMSQPVFAGVLNVSTKTVQSWEQGTRKPSQSALR